MSSDGGDNDDAKYAHHQHSQAVSVVNDDQNKRYRAVNVLSDLKALIDKEVCISCRGGHLAKGVLISYDDAANCIIKVGDKTVVVLGRSISFVLSDLQGGYL